jgi:hypothetical protein
MVNNGAYDKAWYERVSCLASHELFLCRILHSGSGRTSV